MKAILSLNSATPTSLRLLCCLRMSLDLQKGWLAKASLRKAYFVMQTLKVPVNFRAR